MFTSNRRSVQIERSSYPGKTVIFRYLDHLGNSDIASHPAVGYRTWPIRIIPCIRIMCLVWNTSRTRAIVFAQMHSFAIAGYDSCSILSTMLQDGQAIVERLVNRIRGYDTDNAAHGSNSECIHRISISPVPDGTFIPGISDLPAPDGPFIHPKAAQRTKLLFVTASSRFRGRLLSPW